MLQNTYTLQIMCVYLCQQKQKRTAVKKTFIYYEKVTRQGI